MTQGSGRMLGPGYAMGSAVRGSWDPHDLGLLSHFVEWKHPPHKVPGSIKIVLTVTTIGGTSPGAVPSMLQTVLDCLVRQKAPGNHGYNLRAQELLLSSVTREPHSAYLSCWAVLSAVLWFLCASVSPHRRAFSALDCTLACRLQPHFAPD